MYNCARLVAEPKFVCGWCHVRKYIFWIFDTSAAFKILNISTRRADL